MNVRRHAVVVNPRGGKRNGLRVLEPIQSDIAEQMNCDGEMKGNSPMTATLMHSALSVFVK